MKLSIKEINQKILAKEEAQILKEQKKLELKKLKQAEDRKKRKLLSEISEKALDSALNGNLDIEISIGYSTEEIEQITEIAEKYFILIEEMDYSESIDNQLRNYFSSLDKTTISTITKTITTSAWRLRDLCDELKEKNATDNEYETTYVVDLLDECLNPHISFNERVTSLNSACSELRDLFNYVDDAYFLQIFDQKLAELAEIFSGTWLFREIDEDAISIYLSWDEHTDDDVFNYEPCSDFFNVVGLSWIASSHGQLFISALTNLIDQKIDSDKSSLLMHLFKNNSAYNIVLENGAEVNTLLDEKGLTNLFIKLGYKVIQSPISKDKIAIEISWDQKKL